MNKKTVLIVEDEAIVAADLAAKLGQLGYDIVGTVARGDEAVESALRLRPGVILMDIRLKGPMDGIEAAEAIRQRIDVPVIYLTAHSDAATLERAKLSEPFGYILKPFEERELKTNIEMALHKHQSDSEKRLSRDAMRKALDELELRTAELRTANESLRASRVAALNLMEDAVEARKRAEETSVELRREIVERKKAEEEIKRHNAVLNGINMIFKEALTSETDEVLARACLSVAEEITGSKFGFIGEIGPDGLLHDTAISDPGWALCAVHDKTGHRRSPGDFKLHGIYGRVLLDGKSFFTNDPASHPDSIGTPEGHPPLKAFLGVPLVRSGKTIGMIAMGNREGGYRQEDLDSLEALAPAIVEAQHRLRAEKALRASEKRLNRSQDMAHLGSWELDLVNNRLTWSDEVYRIFGLRPQEFDATYEAFLEAVHPDDRAAVDAAYSGSIREGKDTYEIEHKVVRKATGEIRYVHEKCQHFRDETGKIIRSIGMVHDITERKQAEDALRDSETKYRSLFENMIDGLAYHRVVTDENGKPVDYVFLETNEAFERLTGLKRADIIGKSVREALPGIENDPADWIGTYGKVALTGQEVRFQHYAVQLGKWYSVSAYSPMEGYFVTIFEDVTESKKSEEALRESEERFRSMFERHQAVMLLIEPESGAIVDANAAAGRFYGYSREQLRAMRIQDINQLKPEDVAAERRAAAEEKRNYFIFPHRLADGRFRWVEVYSTPFEAQGRPLLFSVIHDITERKQAEADVLKLSEDMAARNLELETVNKELESFVYSVSHDLRAPLRSVSGFAKILVEDYIDKLDAQASDYLARIYSGSEKMSQRIEALMHLTKISRQGLERIEVNLSRVASAIVFDLRQANPGRNVEVVIAEGLTASADLNLMKVALSNLFENALKFTSKTENASVEFGAVDSPLRISECGLRNEMLEGQVNQEKTVYYVKDNGAGFDPKYADRMFWPFHRLHSDQEFEGTGIGLAIVERVVRRHGGSVWAEGEPGKGATVYFTLG